MNRTPSKAANTLEDNDFGVMLDEQVTGNDQRYSLEIRINYNYT